MSLVFKRLQSNLNIFPLIREVAENFNDFHTALGRQKTIPVQKETMTIYLVKGIRIPGEGNYHSRLSNSQQIVKTKSKATNQIQKANLIYQQAIEIGGDSLSIQKKLYSD